MNPNCGECAYQHWEERGDGQGNYQSMPYCSCGRERDLTDEDMQDRPDWCPLAEGVVVI